MVAHFLAKTEVTHLWLYIVGLVCFLSGWVIAIVICFWAIDERDKRTIRMVNDSHQREARRFSSAYLRQFWE